MSAGKEFLKKCRRKWHRDVTDALDKQSRAVRKGQKAARSQIAKLQEVCGGVSESQQALRETLRQELETMGELQRQLESLRTQTRALEEQVKGAQKDLREQAQAIRQDLQTQAQTIQQDLGNQAKAIRQTVEEQGKAARQTAERNVKTLTSWEDTARRIEAGRAFSLLEDRTSQEFFWDRLHFWAENDLTPLFRHLIDSDRRGDPRDILWLIKSRMGVKDPAEELIIFGNTWQARELLTVMGRLGCRVDYMCRADDPSRFTHPVNKVVEGFDWFGVPMLTERELFESHRSAQVAIGYIKCGEAKEYLLEKGLPADHLWRRHTQWEPQYLDPEIMRPRDHEIYVDGGAFDLASSREFADWCGGKYDAIYAFEPDQENYELCRQKLADDPALGDGRVKLFCAALWDRSEQLHFRGGHNDGSTVSDSGEMVVQGMSLDAILQGAPVTFIKLDVEGAELSALKGARETIKKWKPRLAVCIYHKPEDAVELPLYIHGLVPEYKMYIRHYSTCRDETVLYCVRQEDM